MIKKIFSTTVNSNNIDYILLLLRVSVGIFMLTHGVGKFEKLFSGAEIQFPDPLGVGAGISLALTVFSEVFCSIFLIFGFATRLSALPLITTMFVAVFIIHWGDDFGRKELPLIYLVVYLVLAIMGGGRFSIDNWISKKFKK